MLRLFPSRGSFTLALVAVLLFWESALPFIPLFSNAFGKDPLVHGGSNALWMVLNRGISSVVFATLFKWAETFHVGVLYQVFEKSSIWRVVASVLLFDFWTYLWHGMNHRIPFLWQFHKKHHDDTKMDLTTAWRFHVGEIFSSNVLRIPLIIAFGARLEEVAIFETLLTTTVFIHHSNIGFYSFETPLSWLIATPGLHKVHHSVKPEEYDSNYGSLFSFWDRLFGTLVVSNDLRHIKFGI